MKLKSLIFTVFFSFIFGVLSVKAETYSDYISSVERSLFSLTFNKETSKSRLDRIEKNVFGLISNKTIDKRITNLKKIYKYSPNSIVKVAYKQQKPVLKKIKPDYTKLIDNKPPNNLKPKSLVSYPFVDQMEAKVFKRVFGNEDLYKRVERLEIAVFKQNINDELSNRVDRLKDAVLGNYNYQPNDATQQSSNLSPNLMDKDSINLILSKLEEETFKTSFPNEQTEARLDKLENNVFNQTSPEDSVEDRVERLSSVISAKPTSEIYKDMAQLNQYQNLNSNLTVAAILLLILKGLLF